VTSMDFCLVPGVSEPLTACRRPVRMLFHDLLRLLFLVGRHVSEGGITNAWGSSTSYADHDDLALISSPPEIVDIVSACRQHDRGTLVLMQEQVCELVDQGLGLLRAGEVVSQHDQAILEVGVAIARRSCDRLAPEREALVGDPLLERVDEFLRDLTAEPARPDVGELVAFGLADVEGVHDPEAGEDLDGLDSVLLALGLDRAHPLTARSEDLDPALALSHLAS